MPPAAEHCFDLDDGKATPVAAAPVKQPPQQPSVVHSAFAPTPNHPAFEPARSGPPGTATIITHHEPMVAGGKRSNEDTDQAFEATW
jgi:hypothetical protein